MWHIILNVCVECMMFNEFGLWFPPYKIDPKTNFLVLMAIIFINNWDIYSWHCLVYTFVWLNIVSCQSLSHLTLFPNPSSMCCNTNLGCENAFAFVRRMSQILHVNLLMCEVACSQNVTSFSLHSLVISCIVVTNYAKALSIGVTKFIVSLDLTMPPIRKSFYSMVVNPLNSMIPLSPLRCSSSPSLLDSISFGICHGSVNMWLIICFIIMNDIFLSNVCACENHHNLVFTHVPLQCLFTCGTRYFYE